jgi:hypothetical protein
MWKLIKSEISYYKILIVTLYLVTIPFFILNVMVNNFEQYVARMMILILPIVGIITNREEKRSKKIPLHVRLPIPLRQIAISRLGIWLPFWISLMFLFWLSSLIGNHGHNTLWLILTIMNAMIILMLFSIIIFDLRYCFKIRVTGKRFMPILATISIILATLYVLITFSNEARSFLTLYLFTSQVASVSALLCIMLLLVSVFIFEHRKSYLE